MEYTTATPAASDGVKYPENIPPSIISGIINAQTAFLKVSTIYLNSNALPSG